MATGDTNDISNRLQAVLPPWFSDVSSDPVLSAVISGISDAFSFVYSYLQFAGLQTRIATATGGWLDLIAWDYFGARFLRFNAETDASFQPRILKEILRPRQTRAAVSQALIDLTGKTPEVLEFWNPYDAGALDVGTLALDTAGFIGDTSLNNQIFVTAFRPSGEGVPYIAGLDTGAGGLDVGALSPIDMSQVTAQVTDADIYACVAQTIAAGITAWTAILSGNGSSAFVNSLEFNNKNNSMYIGQVV